MIDLYTWRTPNGYKASIMLEEVALPYDVHPVDISKGQQFAPEFLVINPNNKIPAIVDREGPGGKPFNVFESGAILLYLAEKTGRLLPKDPRRRSEAVQWLMFQMGGVGPMFGQYSHFAVYAKEKIPYAIKRYLDESLRLLGVLDKRLAMVEYLAGEYSVADVATYPWVSAMLPRLTDAARDEVDALGHVKRWLSLVGERPAVKKGLGIPPAK